MKALGIIVNVLAILVGGGFGSMLCCKWPPRIQRLILQCIGIVALFLGARSLIGAWFTDAKYSLEVTGTMLVLFALLIGGLFGEALQLDRLLDKLGKKLSFLDKNTEPEGKGTAKGGKSGTPSAAQRKEAVKKAKAVAKGKSPEAASAKTPADGAPAKWWQISQRPDYALADPRTGNRFADGFALATVLCAVSAMAFSGSIAAGLDGETKELFIKAAIDAVLVFFLSSIYGMGATFGAIPVLAVEAIMLFVSDKWSKMITPTLTAHFVIIAAIITLGAGINLCFGKKWRVINLVPALLISPIYGLIVEFAEKALDK